MRCMTSMTSLALGGLLLAGVGVARADADGQSVRVWRNLTSGGANQSAVVGSSERGVSVGISVTGAGGGQTVRAAGGGGRVTEQPRGGSMGTGVSARGTTGQSSGQGVRNSNGSSGSGGGLSVPALFEPSLSNGGANTIVSGLPNSVETGPGGMSFGGAAIGGWSFFQGSSVFQPAVAGVTTDFAPVGTVQHIDPWVLAQQAVSEFPLPGIELEVNPNPGRVNVESWFWAAGYDGDELRYVKTQHASHTECRLLEGLPDCRTVDDSVTVEVRLMPRQYRWTFGDDRDNERSMDGRGGLGHPYTDPQTPSSVAHVYHWSSIELESAGGYPITLTVDWSAEFSVNGGGGHALPDVRHTYTGRHQVRQVQSVVRE